MAVSRALNCVQIQLDQGWAQIRWITAGAVRVAQVWTPTAPRLSQGPAVEYSFLDEPEIVTLTSRELTVQFRKRPFRVTYLGPSGELLLSQSRPAEPGAIEFGLGLRDRLYGRLTAAPTGIEVRGQRGEVREVFLTSPAGYGLAFARPGRYRVDAGAERSETLSIRGEPGPLEYFFLAGGGLKEVFSQAHDALPASAEVRRIDAGFLPPDNIPESASVLQSSWPQVIPEALAASLNRELTPAFPLGPFAALPEPLRNRVDLTAALFPLVIRPAGYALSPAAFALRRSLESHLLTYFQERNDRGFPVLHPLAFQFPQDPEAARITDQFLLGDELLVAPLLAETGERRVYLPQGIWTELRHNHVYRGRRWIQVPAAVDEIPLFARNGSIVPRNDGDRIALHYFPQLGAEYFLWEPELKDITQVHAGPAGDYLRLQIEERIGRPYDWVIHNVVPPREVESRGEIWPAAEADLRDRTWRYDPSRRELTIRLHPRPGEDRILNIRFTADSWAIAPPP